MNDQDLENLLATTLKRSADAPQPDTTAVNRVLARLSGPLPRQKFALWRLPAVLLDWEFAPAWPRVVALATCAVLGFLIGLIGLDRQVDTADAALSYVSRADLGGIVFEAEPPRGAKQ
ncbi:MAG TPA: hypothetical protein VK522_15440 [Pseudolabrys sp.]|nr:hypothetical protein [Pseudolabrys sp.]